MNIELIGKNIKMYRNALGLSQLDVGNFLDVDRSLISHYENGERSISLPHLTKLADLFGIEAHELLEENDNEASINIAFAFRADEISSESLKEIASFKRIVKNYSKMSSIVNEQI